MIDPSYIWWAVALGAVSAVSLPLGSALGLVWRPSDRTTGAMTAFGAGALIAALAVELVAPAAETVTAASHAGVAADVLHHARVELATLLAGCICGGSVFVVLDQLLNARGGFLRKTATSIAFLSKARAKRHRTILRKLAASELLREVPPEHVQQLVEDVRLVTFHDGEHLFEEGAPGDVMYFIDSGEVALEHDHRPLRSLHAGDVVGEIALLTGAPRTATGLARGDVHTLALARTDFDRIRDVAPAFDRAVAELASERLDQLAERRRAHAEQAAEWARGAVQALREGAEIPTADELRRARQEHGGAPLAIWLGILLDGLPESFVIGATLLATLTARHAAGDVADLTFASVVPLTLIVGLFLSNFPEALSSSVGMRTQGWARWKVFAMWSSLMVITAAGAGLGYWLGGSAPHQVVAGVEGLAAGAMLTMVASAMLPEAVHLGGPVITGLGTLAGFLAAVACKLI